MAISPFKVKAIYEYSSPHEDDLNFSIGQVITVTEAEEDDWYTGEYTDDSGSKKEGLFPRNFVERYEPDIPSRPARPARAKKETEAVAPPPPEVSEESSIPAPEREPLQEAQADEQNTTEAPADATFPVVSPVVAPLPVDEKTAPPAVSSTPKSPPAATSEKASSSKPRPPTVGEKPAGNSFKDRIAAFNKQAAAPVAPFKPAGTTGSSGFIKKPFVAPPPSRNAYVPPARDPPPQKVYKRDEEPELAELPPPPPRTEEPEEGTSGDQPKPTSLKDRIALLQKQQLEQASKRAEAVQKKEKPKRPPKKRVESQEQVEQTVIPTDSGDLERVHTTETAGKKSFDIPEEVDSARSPPSAASISVRSPPLPARELTSDTNDADFSDTEDAGLSTGREDSEDKFRPAASRTSTTQPSATEAEASLSQQGADDEGDVAEEDDEDEDQDVDPEIKRRMELRERMAKMSGGMGMMGMFGTPGGMPAPGAARKSKPSGDSAKNTSGSQEAERPAARAPPVPLMALPGMSRTKSPEQDDLEESVEHEDEEADTPSLATSKARGVLEVPDIEDVEQPHEQPVSVNSPSSPQVRSIPPPLPKDTRPAPPPVPISESVASPQGRPVPPPPARPAAPMSPGELSDDEMSIHGAERPEGKEDAAPMPRQPPVAPISTPQGSYDTPKSPLSPVLHSEKRMSRPPPPLPPTAAPGSSPQTRAPPPPPPGPPSRKNTSDSRAGGPTEKLQGSDDSEEEETEYDGDYDTDIAAGEKHKDALKALGRDSSVDGDTTADESGSRSPASPPVRGPPSLPATAPRDGPPPPPMQAPKHARQSSEMPRVAPPPPPVPPPKEASADDDEYDPYRYSASNRPSIPRNIPPPLPVVPPHQREEEGSDDIYDTTPMTSNPPVPPPFERAAPPPPPTERAAPPPPPTERPAPPPPSNQVPPTPTPTSTLPIRESVDMSRPSYQARRSVDQSRPSVEQGFMASDIDIAPSTFWWTQQNTPPPSLQSRKDVLFEMESNTAANRGGKVNTTTNIYVLYMDYSQTAITLTFDPSNPADYSVEQRHSRPPATLRQDQLEAASTEFGTRITAAVESKQNTTVGNGTPRGLVLDIISSVPGTLKPIGTRSYGALVYANLANASFQQYDEIRPGDIVTFRNAKFQGHRGTMHQKYNIDLTKSSPDHVGIVVDWDGTKKKVRAWEQGRESKKVKVESFKLGDLRSGECKIWRVMGRKWIGWE
ncbi:putative sh3 domain protein [Phaeomoniella chlamydospora]|uniref:Putative sh3 domain protein n=1 Tax=Phaeomoniella chlamydospora TaxID=158046 RepID=A0A0G2GCY1_PHACM|nr:putative sh3 domain protein [Phaeomoniella chlamydospora]